MSIGKQDKDNMYALVKKAQEGDAAAFDALYGRYITPIFRFVYYRVRSREDAEDITQTVFIKAWNALPNYKEYGRPFSAWLYAIARNATVDHWKKKRDIIVGDPDLVFLNVKDERSGAERMLEEKNRSMTVKHIVNALDGDQQDVIILRFIEGYTNKEIAGLMEKSEEAVRQIQCRAIRKLRERFKESDIL